MEQLLNPVEKVGSFHSHKTLATDVVKGRHQKNQDCKALEVVCHGCGTKGHFEKVCLKSKCSANSLEVPQASTSPTRAGELLYFDDQGQPVFSTQMVSVLHLNKHLIKFPIDLDYAAGTEWNIPPVLLTALSVPGGVPRPYYSKQTPGLTQT